MAENRPAGTTVGAFSTTGSDAGSTFAYTPVSGSGSADNSSFSLSGNTLRAAAAFSYEAKSNYSIRVRSTDQGGLYLEKVFTTNAINVNERPAAQHDNARTDKDTPLLLNVLCGNDVLAGWAGMTPCGRRRQ